MKQRFLWLIILIVLLPVGLLTWFGVRFAATEKVVTQQRFQQLMQERLSDVNRQVAAQFEEAERALQQVTAFDAFQLDEIREIVRTKPQVSQIFVLRSDGELLYPQPGSALNVTERSFLQQASKMFTGKDLQNAVALREAELLRGQQGSNAALGWNGNMPMYSGPADSTGPLIAQNNYNVLPTNPQLLNVPPVFAPASPMETGRMPLREPVIGQSVTSPDPFGMQEPLATVPGITQLPTPNLVTQNDVAGSQPGEPPSDARITPSSPATDPAAEQPPLQASVGQTQTSPIPLNQANARSLASPQVPSLDPPQIPQSNDVAGTSPQQSPENRMELPAMPQQSRSAQMPNSGFGRAGFGANGLAEGEQRAGGGIPQLSGTQELNGPPAQRDNRESTSNAMPNAPGRQRVAWPQSSGWFVWYWDRGMNLIYWQRRPSGLIVGAALERSRWISDLICALPETDQSRKVADAVSFRVVGSASETIYTWGPEWPGVAPAFCELPLANPLASWRLQCFVPATLIPTSGGGMLFNLIAGLGAVTLTLSAMGWVLYRDYSRDMREASQQVSFVNQVSHELKTPLTNIRMYAELLEKDIETLIPDELASDSRPVANDPRRRLEVITSEAQRLSRLIGNVLTFARQQRKTLQLQPQPVRAVDVVRNIVDRFTPSLAEHQISATVSGSTPGTHRIDTDFLEQILGNLISNVEKYAASGHILQVHVSAEEDRLLVDVKDCGPGIPTQYREEIFRPFARLDNDVRSASGTGIGLTIARELARQHGGDLLLMNSDNGCWFRIQLRSV